MKLPGRIAKALKRIILLPKDVYRFCGSMKMLLQFMMYMKRDESKLPMLKQITEKQEIDEVEEELEGSKAMEGVRLPGGLSKLEEEHASALSMEIKEDVEDPQNKKAKKEEATGADDTAAGDDDGDDAIAEEVPELAKEVEEAFDMRMSTSNSIRESFSAAASRTDESPP